MTITHQIQCNACETVAPLIPTTSHCQHWMQPFGWADVGHNRHLCPRCATRLLASISDGALAAEPQGSEGER
jgi:hypothetical protein